MKKSCIIFFILVLFSKAALSQVEGDVRSKDYKWISKATVIAMDTAQNIIDSVLSDADGYYSFQNLKPGKYFIQAKAAGYETRIYKNIIAREKFESKAGADISNATRLQIILSPVKPPKQ